MGMALRERGGSQGRKDREEGSPALSSLGHRWGHPRPRKVSLRLGPATVLSPALASINMAR